MPNLPQPLSPPQEFSQRFRFSDWPNPAVPTVAAGVYVIWENETLVYCGMSGRELEKAVSSARKKYGLITRLSSHASGRLSGDQFCVYVANRLVIPTLKAEQLEHFGTGKVHLDALTRTYIHTRLEYQYVCVPTSAAAYDLERRCRNGAVFGLKPVLNPA